MNKKLFSLLLGHFCMSILILWVAFVTGRAVEGTLLALNHGAHLIDAGYMIAALGNDLMLSILLAIPLGVILSATGKLYPRSHHAILIIFPVLTGLVHLFLVVYYSETLVPLGAEFWSYSTTELADTVKASNRVTLTSSAFLILSLFVFTWFLHLIAKSAQLLLTHNNRTRICTSFLLIISLLVIGIKQVPMAQSESGANKFTFFIQSGIQSVNYSTNDSFRPIGSEEFPFLKAASKEDPLGPFFREIGEKPNIVFIIVESLGGEFAGDDSQWSGFTPFLDSIIEKSLYWKNGLSLSGRTFGIMPSLLGSLPPGRQGFMSEGPVYPDHLTLISILKEQGYHTSYFSGFDTYFDDLDFFLDYQGIDFKMNKDYIQRTFPDEINTSTENYWGFDDKTMLRAASHIRDTVSTFPRLEIYHTLQSHSPFTTPEESFYSSRFDRLLNQKRINEEEKEQFRRYRSELTTLAYTDDALRDFFDSYKQHDHYENTIFIITGDHWLIPVPQNNQITRYHVPIIIYSPLLKKSVSFKSVNTHAAITPSIISLLGHNTNFSAPDSVHWLGSVMDTSRSFQNINTAVMMKTKNQLSDVIDHDFYYSDGVLYTLEPGLRLSDGSDSGKKKAMEKALNDFRAKNNYVVQNNRLYPGKVAQDRTEKYKFITENREFFATVDSMKLTPDERFELARQYAFNGKYEESRLIADRLLIQFPNYHDVRILKGRTYAWNGDYEKARKIFQETLDRDAVYYDTYNALFDTEYWDGNYGEALQVIEEGLKHHPSNEQFHTKKERVVQRVN